MLAARCARQSDEGREAGGVDQERETRRAVCGRTELGQMQDGTSVPFYSSNYFAAPVYGVKYALANSIGGLWIKQKTLLATGIKKLIAPGAVYIAMNSVMALLHVDWKGGSPMLTAFVGCGGDDYAPCVKAA